MHLDAAICNSLNMKLAVLLSMSIVVSAYPLIEQRVSLSNPLEKRWPTCPYSLTRIVTGGIWAYGFAMTMYRGDMTACVQDLKVAYKSNCQKPIASS